MATILIIDDVAIFREPIAATLQLAGFDTVCAVNGADARTKLDGSPPDLILLDLAMPQMDGITFLRHLRAHPKLAKTPVVLLTAVSDRERIVEAARLGVQDCMLKSRFSTKDLIARIQRHLTPAPQTAQKAQPATSKDATAHDRSAPAAAVSASAARNASAPVRREDVQIPQLLSRDDSLARAEQVMAVHTLSGVVSQVISLAASPRSDMSSLATLISRDAVLAAKVLQAANSAANAGNGGMLLDLTDAVRRIGTGSVRNIAAAMGVYDSIPPSGGDESEFNFVRCWQHSLAVATLCERLVAASSEPEDASVAYLVGLCHDLGEILFHAHFQREYRQVLKCERLTGRRRQELELQMLGVTHHDLIGLILQRISLPDNIREPIEAFHDPAASRTRNARMAKVLKLADGYANGLLLASSPNFEVAPLARADCRAAVGKDDPEAPSAELFRGEILTQTAVLARLPSSAERTLTEPLFARSSTRVWLAREPVLSRFDPVAAMLESLAETRVADRLPSPQEAEQMDRVVVMTRNTGTTGFGPQDVARIAAAGKPCLWLVQKADAPLPPNHPAPPQVWPVRAARLATFVAAAEAKSMQNEAA